MKYTLSIAACLLFSYSSTLVTSDRSEEELTRHHYMHSDGPPGVLIMNQDAQNLFRQYPELLPALLNISSGSDSDEDELNPNTGRHSASSSQPGHTRAHAHNADQPYTGVGRKESVWPQTPSAAESVAQPPAEIAEQKTKLSDTEVIATAQKPKKIRSVTPFDHESDSDESDDADDANFAPYRTINVRSTGCWQRVTHRISSWCCTRKKQA